MNDMSDWQTCAHYANATFEVRIQVRLGPNASHVDLDSRSVRGPRSDALEILRESIDAAVRRWPITYYRAVQDAPRGWVVRTQTHPQGRRYTIT